LPTSEPTATSTATPDPPDPPNGPATLSTNSSRGIVNSNLRLTLSGFPANSYVEISFSGATVAGLTTTPEGTVSVAIKVPAKPAGTYPIWAVSGTESASASYTIAPRVKVLPGSAGAGEQVEVSLRGFGRNEAVRIRWLVDGRWVQVGFVDRTSNTGSANILVTVPEGADPGSAKVRGDGPVARAQTNAFVVTE
jgi:hypothetical protein